MYRLRNFRQPKKKFSHFLQPIKNSRTIWTKIKKSTILPKGNLRKCLRGSPASNKKLQPQKTLKIKMRTQNPNQYGRLNHNPQRLQEKPSKKQNLKLERKLNANKLITRSEEHTSELQSQSNLV